VKLVAGGGDGAAGPRVAVEGAEVDVSRDVDGGAVHLGLNLDGQVAGADDAAFAQRPLIRLHRLTFAFTGLHGLSLAHEGTLISLLRTQLALWHSDTVGYLLCLAPFVIFLVPTRTHRKFRNLTAQPPSDRQVARNSSTRSYKKQLENLKSRSIILYIQ
jgi:hypothetical protein